jgi:serine/threonine-protein kinase
MTLAAGTRLGQYEVLSLIGAGGMGEVYRAKDTKLGRDVALKILPVSFTNDPGRVARFRREAQVLASLNHPHIAHIHGVEESGGVQFLVLEFVDGGSLDNQIASGPIPVEETLAIARQIAEAIEAAHEKGIIHRDLKPANIALTSDGTVKVLDFGLAKAVETSASISDPSTSPTITSPMETRVGVILGTAAYMAPEQARGKSVDRRADIWAFGCVVFEMLTGARAFPGSDVSDVFASILKTEPKWSALPSHTPPAIQRLLRRCLDKDPRRRMQSLGDARVEIEDAIAGTPETLRASSGARVSRWRAVLPWSIAAVVAALGAAALWSVFGRHVSQSSEVLRSLISVTPADVLQSLGGDGVTSGGRPVRTAIALSSDGRTIVFSGVQAGYRRLYVRRLDQLDASPIAGTEGALNPFFSPDAQKIGFWSNNALRWVATSGGPPTRICETAMIVGADWTKNDVVVFAKGAGGLWTVPAGGGEPRPLTKPIPNHYEYSHRLPHALPDGDSVIFTITPYYLPDWDKTRLAVASLKDGTYAELDIPGADGRFVSSGHLVFVRSGLLVAAPFDLSKRKIAGSAVTVMTDVMQTANATAASADSGAGQFAVSESGSLLYVPGGIYPDGARDYRINVVDRGGSTIQTLPTDKPRPYWAPFQSPDGSSLVLWTQGLDRNVWTYDLERHTLNRVTTVGRNQHPIWTRDGKHITYAGSTSAGVDNIFWIPTDGVSAPDQLTKSENIQQPSSWSPNGEMLAFVEAVASEGKRTFALTLESREIKPLVGSRFSETYPEFSPDGHLLAYVSNQTNRDEVYIQTYPGGSPKRVSTEGGVQPAWSHDGRELFYTTSSTKLMAVSVVEGPPLRLGDPHLLFESRAGHFVVQANTRGYDVTPDGKFVFVTSTSEEHPPLRPTEMILVQNWLEELKRRVPVK